MADAVELLVLCVHAGRSPHQAVAELGARGSAGDPRVPSSPSTSQLHRGRSLADALGELPRPARTGRARAGGRRSPAPTATDCRSLRCSIAWPTEARAARRRHGEAEARRLPVRMTFPLVICTLPSFVLLAIAPAVLGALSTLRATAP